MFDIEVQNRNGKVIDVAVDMRFANDLIEVTVDEDESVMKELAKDEFIYLIISNSGNMFGQSKLMEVEILIEEINGSYVTRVNTIKPGK